jgi:hypothetical protein
VSYDAAKAAAILDEIAEGTPLRVICRKQGMPKWRTVYLWLKVQPEFADAMKVARDIGHDAIAQECQQLADKVKPTTEHIQKAKLQIETRLKLLAKWDKRYSDKVTLAGDAENPLTVTVQRLTDGAK